MTGCYSYHNHTGGSCNGHLLWILPPRNLGSDKSGCCLQRRILSHVSTRTRPELSTVINLYLACRFVSGCSCIEVDTATGVNLVLSKSEYQKNELAYTQSSCQNKLFSVTLLAINMLGNDLVRLLNV